MIAFDAVSTNTVNVRSWSHTCAGANRILLVATSSLSNEVTGVTYAGLPLSVIGGIGNGTTGHNVLWWVLLNPPLGTNTVALIGALTQTIAIAVSYTGAYQAAAPDAWAAINNVSATSLVSTITTVADQAWTILVTDTNDGNSGISAGGVRRWASAAFAFELFDSNAPITPPGATSMTTNTGSGSAIWASVMLSIAPVAAVPLVASASFSLSAAASLSEASPLAATAALRIGTAAALAAAAALASAATLSLSTSARVALSAPLVAAATVPFSAAALVGPSFLFTISGTTKDVGGAALPGCTVHLFRQIDNAFFAATVSDGSGLYSLAVPTNSTLYYARAYKAGAPDLAGTTLNNLTGS